MFFVFLKRFRQKFCWCLCFCQLKWVLFLLKMFLSFDRSIIAFFNSFDIKQLLSCCKTWVLRHNSSVLFYQNFMCFGQNDPIKVQIFSLLTACMKTNQIPNVILQARSVFFLVFQFSSFPVLNFALPFSVMTHNSSGIF